MRKWDEIIYDDMDIHGRVLRLPADFHEMSMPVRCRCGHVYDVGRVTVVARYADCSVWKCPKCGIDTDDRIEGWGPPRKYVELDRTGRPKR